MARLKKATVPFYKTQEDNWTRFLLELNGDQGVWSDFVPPNEQIDDGMTQYMKLYKDEQVGVFMFRSEDNAYIPPHWHRWPERVVFLSGKGTMMLGRDKERQVMLTPERSILIPADTIHEGTVIKGGLSICTFYYT